jgi:predicted TIM-barrel fold metal-dependent hydrolase
VKAPGAPFDEVVRPLYEAALGALTDGAPIFDAHTHIGDNDPDGFTATAEEIVAGLDRAGHARALTFAFHEPGGYRDANDAVLAACAGSDGRLLPLARVAPGHEDALAEARRCLEAGALGVKLHPRSDGFGLPHPAVEEIIALAHERRAPVLFHAGRGIPRLGESVVEYARAYPGARLILAHAGISDLGWIGPAAAELGNLFFDTSWWLAGDLLSLYASVPPARILYASDLPYGSGMFAAFAFLRCASAVGLSGDALAAIAGGSLERVLAGEEPLDLGPAPGLGPVAVRDVDFERTAAWLAIACSAGFRGGDPTEALGLAALACHRADGHPVARKIERLVEDSLEQLAAGPPRPALAMYGALTAQLLAGTAQAGV